MNIWEPSAASEAGFRAAETLSKQWCGGGALKPERGRLLPSSLRTKLRPIRVPRARFIQIEAGEALDSSCCSRKFLYRSLPGVDKDSHPSVIDLFLRNLISLLSANEHFGHAGRKGRALLVLRFIREYEALRASVTYLIRPTGRG